MKPLKLFVVLFAVVLLAACTTSKPRKDSLVDITGYSTIYKDTLQGDSSYALVLDAAQKAELDKLLQPEGWTVAPMEELPQHGLPLALCAESDEFYMYVSPWAAEEKTIIKLSPINAIGDGSDSLFYFASADVGENAAAFIATLEDAVKSSP